MLEQLWAAARIWATRKLLWATAAVWIAIHLIVWLQASRETAGQPGRTLRTASPGLAHIGRTESVGISPQESEEALRRRLRRAATINLHGSEPHEQRALLALSPDITPRLRTVFCYSTITARVLDALLQRPIEGLQLASMQQLPNQEPATIRDWSRATQLTYLNLMSLDGMERLQHILWPPRLQTFLTSEARPLPMSWLNDLSELPDVQVLQLMLPAAADGVGTTAELVEVLQRFPRLRTLYLVSNGQPPGWIDTVARQLPRLSVRPSSYSMDRINAAWLTMTGTIFGLGAVIWQLSTVLLIPLSHVVPRYRWPHVVLTGLLSMLVLGAEWTLLVLAGTDWWAAAGCCGLAALPVVLLMTIWDAMKIPGVFSPALLAPLIVTSTFLGTLLRHPEVDWWLSGHFTWLSTVFLIVGVAGVGRTVVWLIGVARLAEEIGGSPTSLKIIGPDAWTAWQQRPGQPAPFARSRWNPMLRMQSRDLERVLQSGLVSDRERRALWMACGPMNPRYFAVMMGVLMTVGMSGFGFLMWLSMDSFNMSQAPMVIAIPVAQIGLMWLIMSLAMLFDRRRMFAMELLRPVNRADWVGDWWNLVQRDVLYSTLLLMVAVIGVVLGAPVSSPEPWGLIVTMVLIAAGCLLMQGLGLWLLPLKSGPILAACIGFTGITVLPLSATLMSIAGLPGIPKEVINHPLTWWTITAVFGGTGWWFLRQARQRWLTCEWGLLSK
jgi:hypothetical protein